MNSYLTLKRGVETRAEVEVKRSRFLAVVRRVDDEASAREVIAGLQREFHDARHHCSAFILNGPSAIERSNDDGEPAGTAGASMLEVLRGAELRDVVAVVVRWFGGTLLGAGGLVRAYGDAVSLALGDAPRVRRTEESLFAVSVPHVAAGKVEADLRAHSVTVVSADYGADVTLHLAGKQQRLASLLAEITSGTAQLVPEGQRWLDLPAQH